MNEEAAAEAGAVLPRREGCGGLHAGAGPRPAPCEGFRVGIVCYPSQGGSGVVATELARELGRRGHCAHVISYQLPFRLHRFGEGVENVAFHQVDVPNYPLFQYPPYVLALATKIAEVARYERLDLVHVHYAVPHSVAAVMAQAMLPSRRLPVITTLHGTDVTQTGCDPAIRDAVQWSLARSDAVTAVSDALATAARQTFGLTEVQRIYNWIDPNAMRRRPDPDLRRRFAATEDAVLVHASNFRAVKNVCDVVRIFAAVRREHRAVLLLCGDGPDAGPAHRAAAELGVEEHVHFVGIHHDMSTILSLADCFLLPSSQESFGLAALEAMACEVPVVCSDVGGLPEVVADGETGFLRPPGDVVGMATAVLLALEPGRHEAMARNARRRAVHRFGSARILPQIESLYASVVHRAATAKA
jgi:N-acetyl-alpha-D-glucosaminyl L-malate synthase BshA